MKARLLLIPGMLNQPSIWADVTDHLHQTLGDALEVVVAKVQTQASIVEMAQDAWTQLGSLDVDAPCFIAGFSMGGYVAMEMLAQPERVITQAWLISTSAQAESSDSASKRQKSIASFLSDFEKTIYSIAQWGTADLARAEQEPLVIGMRELGPETAVRQTRAIMQRRNLRDELAGINVPVQVLCGQEDRITPPQLAEDLAGLIPGAKLEMIEHAGHMLPFEKSERIASLMAATIATHMKRSYGC